MRLFVLPSSGNHYGDVFNAPPHVWSLLVLGYVPLFGASAFLWYQRHTSASGPDKSDLLLNREFFYALICSASFVRAAACISLSLMVDGLPDVVLIWLLTMPSMICTSIESLLVFFWAKLYYSSQSKLPASIANGQLSAVPKLDLSPTAQPQLAQPPPPPQPPLHPPPQSQTPKRPSSAGGGGASPSSPSAGAGAQPYRVSPPPVARYPIQKPEPSGGDLLSRSFDHHPALEMWARRRPEDAGRTSKKPAIIFITSDARQPASTQMLSSLQTDPLSGSRGRFSNSGGSDAGDNFETLSQSSSVDEMRSLRFSFSDNKQTFKRRFSAPRLQQQAHHHPVYVMLNVCAYIAWGSTLALFGVVCPINTTVLFIAVFGIISGVFLVCLGLFIYFGLRLKRVLDLSGKQKSRATLEKVGWMTAICTVCFSIRSLLTLAQLCEAWVAIQFKPIFHFVYFGAFDMAPLGALLCSLYFLSAKRRTVTEAASLLDSSLQHLDRYNTLGGASCPIFYS